MVLAVSAFLPDLSVFLTPAVLSPSFSCSLSHFPHAYLSLISSPPVHQMSALYQVVMPGRRSLDGTMCRLWWSTFQAPLFDGEEHAQEATKMAQDKQV